MIAIQRTCRTVQTLCSLLIKLCCYVHLHVDLHVTKHWTAAILSKRQQKTHSVTMACKTSCNNHWFWLHECPGVCLSISRALQVLGMLSNDRNGTLMYIMFCVAEVQHSDAGLVFQKL